MQNLQPPHPLKKSPLLSQQSLLKVEVLSSTPPLLENLVGDSTPLPHPSRKEGGGCTLWFSQTSSDHCKQVLVIQSKFENIN